MRASLARLLRLLRLRAPFPLIRAELSILARHACHANARRGVAIGPVRILQPKEATCD